MMNKILLLAFAAVVLISCGQPSPETNFDKFGVSFTCPKGWSITEEEDFDGEGYYLSIEKDGFTSSGIVTVTWVNGILDLSDWLDVFKEELKNNIVYKNSDLAFEAAVNNDYNSINSLASKFTATILGVKHQGIIHLFNYGDRTVAVLKQEALEDKAKNKLGFGIIEHSFKVK